MVGRLEDQPNVSPYPIQVTGLAGRILSQHHNAAGLRWAQQRVDIMHQR